MLIITPVNPTCGVLELLSECFDLKNTHISSFVIDFDRGYGVPLRLHIMRLDLLVNYEL